MKKHILAALMTLVITSALLTGCGGRDTTPASPPGEHLILQCYLLHDLF